MSKDGTYTEVLIEIQEHPLNEGMAAYFKAKRNAHNKALFLKAMLLLMNSESSQRRMAAYYYCLGDAALQLATTHRSEEETPGYLSLLLENALKAFDRALDLNPANDEILNARTLAAKAYLRNSILSNSQCTSSC